jgi:WD40 repeat protein
MSMLAPTNPSVVRVTALALAITSLGVACSRGRERDRSAASSVNAGESSVRMVGRLEGLHSPESVKYDPEQDVYFISNMYGYGSAKDGNGYIVRAKAADMSSPVVFVQGGRNGATLDAPKGITLHGDTLWVTDIDVLRAFDRHTGAPLGTIDFRPNGAVLLNDVTVGADGSLYVTDTGILMTDKGVLHPGGDKIFVVGPNRAISVMASGNALGRPNGIAWDSAGRRVIVVSFDPFDSRVYAFRAGDTTRTMLAKGLGKFDGIELLPGGRMLVTSWADSSVHLFSAQSDVKLVRDLSQPADRGLDTRRNRVAVPVGVRERVELWSLPSVEAK